MSGHSKWSTIKRAKGAADQKRGLTFTKIANAITVAAKNGGGDPDSNPHLRLAIEQAKEANMPKDNVQRAMDKGLGKLPGQTLEEVLYEGFGPGKVAFLVEGVTDNKLRTNAEIRNLFDRSGGGMAGQGSVAYMFNKKGEIQLQSKGGDKDDEMLELIDLGADDVEDYVDEEANSQMYLVYTQSPELNTMNNKITQLGFTVLSSEIMMKPNITTEISDEATAQKVMDFIQKLEEHDDVQKVYANMSIPDKL